MKRRLSATDRTLARMDAASMSGATIPVRRRRTPDADRYHLPRDGRPVREVIVPGYSIFRLIHAKTGAEGFQAWGRTGPLMATAPDRYAALAVIAAHSGQRLTTEPDVAAEPQCVYCHATLWGQTCRDCGHAQPEVTHA